MPDRTPFKNSCSKMNEPPQGRREELERQYRVIMERFRKLRQATEKWRREYRTKIEKIAKNGIIWLPARVSYPYKIVKGSPTVAIARVYGKAEVVDANGDVRIFFRCDLYSKKPIQLNRTETTFQLEFSDFPIEQQYFIDDLTEPITKVENDVIVEIQFQTDPLSALVETGVY